MALSVLSAIEDIGAAPLAALGREPVSRQSVHPWHVMHACEQVQQGLAAVECQIAVGMRPVLITPEGVFGMGGCSPVEVERAIEPAAKLSLRSAWRDARKWTRLARAEMTPDLEIFHAHSLPAALAGLRVFPVIVYDAGTLVADTRGLNAVTLNLLRQAENFVLTHAACVVVHSLAMRHEVLGRGTHPEDVFLISLSTAAHESILGQAYDAVYRHAVARRRKHSRPPMAKLQPIGAAL